MLPTNDLTFIRFNKSLNIISPDISDYGVKVNNYISCQHLYITSDDEIKESDWVYNKVQKTVFKADASFMKLIGNSLSTNHKIIATTDKSLLSSNSIPHPRGGNSKQMVGTLPQPSQAFIEKYCKEGGIDEVLVEYEHRGHFNIPSEHWDYILKTDLSNNIIISFIKDSYSKEEVVKLFELLTYEMAQKIIGNRQSKYPYSHSIVPSDWIEKNL